jgi:hypothetical protein
MSAHHPKHIGLAELSESNIARRLGVPRFS